MSWPRFGVAQSRGGTTGQEFGRGFSRFRQSYTVSTAGSALSAGALPLVFGAGRTVGLLALPFLGEGTGALVVLGVSQFLLLFAAGAFNPLFTTYRMTVTPDELMARVGTAWSVTSRSFQPICITAGGLVAGWLSLRWSLGIAALLCLLSVLFLPWRAEPRRDGASVG